MADSEHAGVSIEPRASSVDSQHKLSQFHSGVAEHVSAIQAAARELVARENVGVGPQLREIRLEIKVGPDPNASRSQYDSIDCWDEDVICGKSSRGYIHCTVHVCMEIGPITMSRD